VLCDPDPVDRHHFAGSVSISNKCKVKLNYFPENSNLMSKILKIMTPTATTLMREIKQCKLALLGIKVQIKFDVYN
jgi:hypothetical protein